jgi:hypothetical protein
MSLHAQFAVLLLYAAVLPLRVATLRGLILANELGGTEFAFGRARLYSTLRG